MCTVRPSLPPALLAAAAVAGLSMGTAVPAAAQGPPQTHTVRIVQSDQTGQISAEPDSIEVNPGDRVEWTGAVDAWTIQVPNAAGIFGRQTAGANGGRNDRAGLRVIPDAARGRRYKYVVAVWDGNRVRILDPEIVIGPG